MAISARSSMVRAGNLKRCYLSSCMGCVFNVHGYDNSARVTYEVIHICMSSNSVKTSVKDVNTEPRFSSQFVLKIRCRDLMATSLIQTTEREKVKSKTQTEKC